MGGHRRFNAVRVSDTLDFGAPIPLRGSTDVGLQLFDATPCPGSLHSRWGHQSARRQRRWHRVDPHRNGPRIHLLFDQRVGALGRDTAITIALTNDRIANVLPISWMSSSDNGSRVTRATRKGSICSTVETAERWLGPCRLKCGPGIKGAPKE